jgi:hypothetical protein
MNKTKTRQDLSKAKILVEQLRKFPPYVPNAIEVFLSRFPASKSPKVNKLYLTALEELCRNKTSFPKEFKLALSDPVLFRLSQFQKESAVKCFIQKFHVDLDFIKRQPSQPQNQTFKLSCLFCVFQFLQPKDRYTLSISCITLQKRWQSNEFTRLRVTTKRQRLQEQKRKICWFCRIPLTKSKFFPLCSKAKFHPGELRVMKSKKNKKPGMKIYWSCCGTIESWVLTTNYTEELILRTISPESIGCLPCPCRSAKYQQSIMHLRAKANFCTL